MCNSSKCNGCNQTPLCSQSDCSCPVKDLSTDCILYTGDDLSCTGVKSGTIMTDLINQIDTYICQVSTLINNSMSLINVGLGTQIYKGLNILGKREIRSITTTNPIVTVGLSTDSKEIAIGVDEQELSDFIAENTTPGIGGEGTVNYVARWTPNGETLGIGLIKDNGETLAFNAILDPSVFMNIRTVKPYGVYSLNNSTEPVIKNGVYGLSLGISTGENRGVEGHAASSETLNTAVCGRALSESGSEAVGGDFSAQGAGTNYAAKLKDGTEGLGKVLTCITSDGKTNWGKVTSNYTTGATGSFTSQDGKTITVTNGLITNIV
jgi:hypothetical protein